MEELKEFLIGLEQRMNEKFREIDEKFEQVVIELENNAERIDRVEKELKREIKQLERTILDKQFLFETEYGKKIDMMYDAVLLELDKNKEKSEKIHKLDARMERSEIKIFNHEKRISILERS